MICWQSNDLSLIKKNNLIYLENNIYTSYLKKEGSIKKNKQIKNILNHNVRIKIVCKNVITLYKYIFNFTSLSFI